MIAKGYHSRRGHGVPDSPEEQRDAKRRKQSEVMEPLAPVDEKRNVHGDVCREVDGQSGRHGEGHVHHLGPVGERE